MSKFYRKMFINVKCLQEYVEKIQQFDYKPVLTLMRTCTVIRDFRVGFGQKCFFFIDSQLFCLFFTSMMIYQQKCQLNHHFQFCFYLMFLLIKWLWLQDQMQYVSWFLQQLSLGSLLRNKNTRKNCYSRTRLSLSQQSSLEIDITVVA